VVRLDWFLQSGIVMYAYEMHVYEMYANEIHVYEMYAL